MGGEAIHVKVEWRGASARSTHQELLWASPKYSLGILHCVSLDAIHDSLITNTIVGTSTSLLVRKCQQNIEYKLHKVAARPCGVGLEPSRQGSMPGVGPEDKNILKCS